MDEQEKVRIEYNQRRLKWLVAAAPYAVAALTVVAGSVSALIASRDRPWLASGVLLADLIIGWWQGQLLAVRIAAKAENPLDIGANYISLVARGAVIGLLGGAVNGLFLIPELGPLALLISPVVGLAFGVALGLLLGVPYAIYLGTLVPSPGKTTNVPPQA